MRHIFQALFSFLLNSDILRWIRLFGLVAVQIVHVIREISDAVKSPQEGDDAPNVDILETLKAVVPSADFDDFITALREIILRVLPIPASSKETDPLQYFIKRLPALPPDQKKAMLFKVSALLVSYFANQGGVRLSNSESDTIAQLAYHKYKHQLA